MPPRHRHRPLSSAALIAAAAALTLAPSAAAPAATKSWTNPAGGSWSDPANWSPTAPASSDTAVFDLNSAPAGYTVTLPSSLSSTGTLAVGNDTLTLAVPAGGAPNFDTLTLAGTSAQTAAATITGGALNLNYATLAPAGSATLTVSPNTTLLTRFTFSSGSAGGSATVDVGGTGALLQASTLQLGTAGAASLNVTAGGVVSGNTAPSTFLGGTASFASASGGSATVTVDGPGSLLSYSTLQLAAPAAPVPAPPSASLVARNGARVAVEYLTAAANGATASLSLDGPGTTLAASGSVTLGSSGGSASLSLTNGATLTGGLYVGTSIGGATGSAAVSVSSGSVLNAGATVGAGSSVTVSSDTASPSTWTASTLTLNAGATATIGAGGQLTATRLTGNGTLRLAGGVASVANSFGFRGTLAGAGSASGFNILPSFTIAPDGTLDFSFGSPGSHSTLTLTPSTRLEFDITSPSTYDRLTTPNTVKYLGTLVVSLDPSYAPAAGDAFDLLDVYARNGTSTFDTLSLPPLPPGLTWDTSALYTTGTLSVTLPEPTPLLAPCVLAFPLLSRRRTKS